MKEISRLDHFFEQMWKDYYHLNPQVQAVYNSLIAAGETVANDHIAFRTWNHPHVNIDVLAKHFLKYGYQLAGEYQFTEKKLNARHFEYPGEERPKVFISELDLSQLSPFVQTVFTDISKHLHQQNFHHESFLYSGRMWDAHYDTYLKLAEESEYAAWVYAHGFRPNHFTVHINHLNRLNSISQLNDFLKKHGFKLNTSGGEIKGRPQDFLEQSSTMANEVLVHFVDGSHRIPACYYEFAKRYPLPNGNLFQGFIGSSADKIFESTHRRSV